MAEKSLVNDSAEIDGAAPPELDELEAVPAELELELEGLELELDELLPHPAAINAAAHSAGIALFQLVMELSSS
jgi:hypothetical protein